MEKIANFIFSLENKKDFSWLNYLLTFIGIVFFRIFLENFSSPHQTGFYTSFYTTFFHYPLFYLSLFLSLNLLLSYFLKIPINKIFRLTIFFFPIILLPPLFDLFITAGYGIKMSYNFQPFNELIRSFYSFFGPIYNVGITPGIRLEILIILIGVFLATLSLTKNIKRSLLAVFFSYLLLFIYLSFPSFLAIIFNKAKSFPEIISFLKDSIRKSYLNYLFPLVKFPNDPILLFEEQFNILMSRIWWFAIFLQTILIFYLAYPKIFLAWIKNLRWTRVFHYFLSAIIGILISHKISPLNPLNWIDIFSFLTFFILIALNFWLAVGINDLFDFKIDSISNKNRPLIKGEIDEKIFKFINLILFAFLFVGSLLFNYLVFILLILFQLIYYLYSAPPLRLKRHFLSSSVLIALNTVIISMAGFYFVSLNQKLDAFPKKIFWLLFFIYLLVSNVKDIKDIEGDRADKIKTIPVVFGEKNGKKIIGFLVGFSTLFVPLTLQDKFLSFLGLFFAILFYYLINRKKYQESIIFLFYFFYAILIILRV